uniref:Uncharacterized protein n=1 Tax=Yersinia enterocolitica W22703 TaxID=913028 RepID=F4N037_YEREN|nr:unknown protein [Yersinia enterocolitica W22703]
MPPGFRLPNRPLKQYYRVEIVFFSVSTDEFDGCFDVIYLCWPCSFWAESVIDINHRIPFFQPVKCRDFVTTKECTTVYIDELL